MLCHLPAAYPDELLYSIISRYLIRFSLKKTSTIASDIFGRETKPQVDIPGSIGVISCRTWPVWRMSSEEIVLRLTLFPFYTRYMPQERADKYLKTLLSDNGEGVHTGLGINGSRVDVPKFLRFCCICRESDLSKYGETYWHRSHQLAGVLVCSEHGELLIDTGTPMRPRRYVDYEDATISTSDGVSSSNSRFGRKETTTALQIAKRCQEMLWGPIELWPAENIGTTYRQSAIERGFGGGTLSIAQSKLETAFVSFYGKALLSQMGCSVETGKGNSWINTIFQRHRSLFHPAEHALVQIFLESIPPDPTIGFFGVGPWKCPNPYAKHEEKFPISKVRIVERNRDQPVASAACGCGFRFTFSATSPKDPSLPIVKKRVLFGPTWIAEAKRLSKSGFTIYSIASKMGIAYTTARVLLRSKPGDKSLSRKQIKMWRREWTKLLDIVPNRSRAIAREKSWPLYNRLHRYDREWLFAVPGNKTHKPHPEGQINWKGRDEDWSRLLRCTAAKIRKRVPLERVTKNAIILQAGISTSIFSYMNRLPLCRLALNECSESRNAFKERSMSV